jgi:hypothetical protein
MPFSSTARTLAFFIIPQHRIFNLFQLHPKTWKGQKNPSTFLWWTLNSLHY